MVPTFYGDKYFTVRKFRQGAHDFKKDEVIIGKFKDGLNVLLQITKDSKIAPFKRLTSIKKNLDKVGYWFNEEYFNDLKGYYPDLNWDDMGAVVFYEVLKVSGVPVVAVNEFGRQLETK
ncbi:MAG: hypothetical protein Q7J30_01760 [Candidatus Azambacteria bacterium]|nr:hypothetical protein [Candidatus Azambacteria bacterium]